MNSIILGTGSYSNVKSGNTLSITGDGGNAWGYFGPSYKSLAPRLVTYTRYIEEYEKLQELKEDALKLKEYIEHRKKIENEYIESFYETRLKDLNVYELLEMLENKYGREIILLCHEDIDEFCHRRVVADYIKIKTGIYIPEVSISSGGKVIILSPISYEDRLNKLIKR